MRRRSSRDLQPPTGFPVTVDDLVAARTASEPSPDLALAARRHAEAVAPLLPDGPLDALVGRVVARLAGLGALEPLLADPDVTEVLVNRGTEVWVERAGRLARASTVLAPGEAEQLLERIIAPLGLRADRLSPVVDARLPDGSRVAAVIPPIAVDGTCLAIRRFGARTIPLDEFAGPPVVALVDELVSARWNLLVSGPTSSGKTTLLNAVAGRLPPEERIVTVEDAAELRLPGPHVVRLEARPPTAEGLGGATLVDLVRAALRLRPDRLVVGEVRGAEAGALLQAMSTGHDGSMATCHANGPLDALARVESMVLQGGGAVPHAFVRSLVDASIDAVIHVERGTDGRRRIAAIAEVVGGGRGGEGRARLLVDGGAVVATPARAPRAARGAA